MGALIMYAMVISVAIGGFFYFRHQDKIEEKNEAQQN